MTEEKINNTVTLKIEIRNIPTKDYADFTNDIIRQFKTQFGNHFSRNDNMVMDYALIHQKGLDDYFHQVVAGALTLDFIRQDIGQEKGN